MTVEIKADVSAFDHLHKQLSAVGNQAPHAIRRAINHVGDKVRTQVVRTLAKQAGVKYGDARRAIRVQRANYSRFEYRIATSGKHLPLSVFGARQTRKGVSAAPWGKRRVFPHSFMVKGRVFLRMGKGRMPIRQMWGPALPKEIVKAETAAIFLATVATQLPARVAHELAALMKGHAPRG